MSDSLVMGIDHDSDLLEMAKKLQAGDKARFMLRGEGDLSEDTTVQARADQRTVEFRCADPMCLPAELKAFDVVILNDVIDKGGLLL